MNKNKILLAVLALALGFGAYKLTQPSQSAPKAGDPTISVQLAEVQLRSLPVVFETSGFVTPVSSVEVRAQLTSTIREVLVHEGDTVAAGAPLFRLDGRAETATLEKLKAQMARDTALLEDARRTLLRNVELKQRGFVSQGVVDASSSNVDALSATVAADRAAIAEAQVAVEHGYITAPQAGRVGLINVRVGSLVQPGSATALTTLTRLDPIDIAFTLPETYLAQLRRAQARGPVVVSVKDAEGRLDGQLNFIDSTVDSVAGGVRIKARFDNAKLRLWPGAQVTVGLTLDAIKDAPTAPLAAIQVSPNGQFVYAIDDQERAKALPVRIRYQDAEFAVLDGVPAGTRVVVMGGQNLRPGVRVRDSGKPAAPKAGAKQ
ncbi:efflux RND transporter periplasmic adaptor subunit [Niveibacterium umoris]|uniref:RND family efflux transporter MFP subunit n=1 Tax=Niveibacterium umoris TaxID=1193620 RepID=A0A840BDH3_9RHOO|nr:efflux RND transporter periplasmic adaptor subunit [Niveibacterium umoris]MBB4011080.1 RND family efflux transporter MFP subunit [Niveibacterium umoris]